MQHLLAAVSADEQATRDFVGVLAGTVAVPEFFDPDTIGCIMARAA
jgi:hypothetical protein